MNTIARILSFALALVLALPRPGPAQDPRLDRLAPEARAVVTALIDSARTAGLPAEPLVDRALEGTSKGAAPPLIAAAVRRLAIDLGRARELLGPGTAPGELIAAADALRAGVPPGVLVQLRDALGPDRLAVPLGVTADLATRGVPPDTAASLVIALARSVADAELLALHRDVERDIALGASPLAAAASRLAGDAEPALDVGRERAGPDRDAPARPRKP